MTAPSIWFLRSGRTRRARGTVIETEPTTGCVKLKAVWPYTQPVWVTPKEIAAGVKTAQPTLNLKSKRHGIKRP